MNIGHSSRLPYDKCAYDDRIYESVSPMLYRLNPLHMANCDGCLSTLGPRSSYQGYGVSTVSGGVGRPTSQDLADVESILTNRNVLASKCKDGKVNDIDVTKFKLQHARACNSFLDPVNSRLTNPPQNYRGMSVNRFYDLSANPQRNIFYPWATNTSLEAKDNHVEKIPQMLDGNVAPKEQK